jgi:formyl-CoA transferase
MQAGRLVRPEGEPADVERDLVPGRLNGLHPTKEGALFLSATNDRFWRALCRELDLGALASDPRYATVRGRAEHAAELVGAVRDRLATRSALDWEARLAPHLPCAAVRGIGAMFDHPQVRAAGLVSDAIHGGLGTYAALDAPWRFTTGPIPTPSGAPGLDEHGAELFASAGRRAG